LEENVIARLTPPGRGAVATVALEGPNALAVLETLVRPAAGPPWRDRSVGRPGLGYFGPEPAEEVVIFLRNARSAEIHCHGGEMAIGRILGRLAESGCRTVSWQDWIARHAPDPIAAAAHLALADARTLRVAAILLDQAGGALGRELLTICDWLARKNAEDALRRIDALLGRAEVGRHLVEPWRVVLTGPPNVGKSSLVNALAGYPRAIVHPSPGTTRDVVTLNTALDGWPVEISDTAGWWASDHPLDIASMESAERQLAQADLAILVFDSSQPWSESDQRLCARYARALVVLNKADLPVFPDCRRPSGWPTSARTGQGVAELAEGIAHQLIGEPPPPGSGVPFVSAQIAALRACRAGVARGDFEEARSAISSLFEGGREKNPV
jgi:tRNA modification GTPase